MSFPRDIGGKDLAKSLAKYGYEISRQTGSHMRLTTSLNGEHHITIPAHKP
jgi:predicted RNA binding protein YcfA (HicA-like mRNA interferase family)